MKEIGIVGYGNFGRLMAGHLKNHFEVFVSSSKTHEPEDNIHFVSFEEAVSKRVVIFSVPVQFMEEVLKRAEKFVIENSIIIDVSSVKVTPVRLMVEILPKSISILGTHPLFGIERGRVDTEGLNIVLCPTRISEENLHKIKDFLKGCLGLKVVSMTPEEHDKKMAVMQAIPHLISKALNDLDYTEETFEGLSYQKLIDLKRINSNNSKELFYTIQKENPYAKEVRRDFLRKLGKIEEDL